MSRAAPYVYIGVVNAPPKAHCPERCSHNGTIGERVCTGVHRHPPVLAPSPPAAAMFEAGRNFRNILSQAEEEKAALRHLDADPSSVSV
ncbi:hypothetical protein HPB50_005871 [Hyalomma asiaticum]|uniref:Uncharacterized protein n=1 Tax=Hyalomma asiaticum TaxID=266040 RepID=A0ACB7SAM5_HYAAI|nr:hypothetical protein HPB50_005871 [Hyalomma asiaticum]